MNPKEKTTYNTTIEATLDVIGGKWKTLILWHLFYGAKRTSELKKKIPGITQKMLTQQLRELEVDGVIIRTIYNQVPPKVVYEISELGLTLKPIIDQMCVWGEHFVQGTKPDGKIASTDTCCDTEDYV
ncbi:helix-turn-helix transcriptional regulator [Paenibacillus sp. GSMTC-2017]|uniref:winged helix-turn-helix transcriptional regulator n=1 Tax=Paenibacillus sp. GSMTC-2017 TaxID=2794350 RepID=UPI0018D957C6|nr:helix-turn-helix domain-containing protein [Paenibacillus sp. GSMTC-2017]MBH5319609.1 helix-turn-helix transcriptional regulator [Paenibacillus sp. GSMTC-2017]